MADGRIRVRLPADWQKIIPARDLEGEGILTLLGENLEGETGQQGEGEARKYKPQTNARILMLFIGHSSSPDLPSNTLNLLLNRLAPVLQSFKSQGRFTHQSIVEGGRLGDLPAATIKLKYQAVDLFRTERGIVKRPRNIYITARIGVSPAGEAVGLAAFTPVSARQNEIEQPWEPLDLVVEQVSPHVHLLPAGIAQPRESALDKAGLDFEIPQNADVLDNQDNLPQTRLMGGSSTQSWYLTICRVPLAGDRKPRGLVRDHVRSLIQDFKLPGDIQTKTFNDREAAWLDHQISREPRQWVITAATATDKDTALLLSGRCEKNGKETLVENMRGIIGQAQAKSFTPMLTKALQRGKKQARETASKGIAGYWPSKKVFREYHTTYVDMILGRLAEQTTPQRKDGLWWSIETRISSGRGQQETPQLRENWLIRDDLAAYQLKYRQPDMQYSEIKRPESEKVMRSLAAEDRSIEEASVTINEDFMCEPALILAAGQVARDLRKEEVIFSTVETYTHSRVYWRLVPLGRKSPPWLEQNAWAIRLYRDHSPSPVTFYFSMQENFLLGLEFPNGIRRTLQQ
jgi:hypothetical protein